MAIILDSIVATDRKNKNILLFVGDQFENMTDHEKIYTVTKFFFGKHHLIELDNVLYGILQIDHNDNSMTLMDIDNEKVITISQIRINVPM